VKVIIPLAGRGTRLRPHTYVTPKPLLRVAGKPVMSYILDDLQTLGVEGIVFITGYLKETIEEYIRTAYPDFRTHFIEQPVQDGTAGAVRLAEPFIDSECLIIFVDTLFDADLTLVQRLPEGVSGVIWAKHVDDYQRFGVIVLDDKGFMRRIVEKPRDPISKLANIGLYYIRDWQLLFEGVRATMEGPPGKGGEFYLTDAFQYMVDRGARIQVEEVEGWYDCGQLETLLDTNRHMLEHGRALEPTGGQGIRVHGPVRIAPGVKLENVELGPHVTVEADCEIIASKLTNCMIGEGTRIAQAVLHDSMIGDHVVVERVSGSLSIVDHSEVRG
jgi:glucose-1-phosphate thymidylyltransferase